MGIEPKHIASKEYRKYGKAIILPEGEPASQGETYKFWPRIADYLIEGETEIGICTVYRVKNGTIDGVERHLETPEILLPIDAPFVLPLLSETGEMEAFNVNIGDAVIINKGIWHAACLPVGVPESSYFVIFKKGTPDNDVEKKSVKPIRVEF